MPILSNFWTTHSSSMSAGSEGDFNTLVTFK